MKVLLNYQDQECFLKDEQELHILERHPEATLELIKECLINPNEIRKSTSNNISHLYYTFKTSIRFFCVVLKVCEDGNFISTAYTTNRIKKGKIVYKKET